GVMQHFLTEDRSLAVAQWLRQTLSDLGFDPLERRPPCPSEAESVGAVFHFHTHAGLLAHWPMDEGEGAAVQDLRGAHHGELLNSPPWGHSWANPFPRLHSAQQHSALLAAEAGPAL